MPASGRRRLGLLAGGFVRRGCSCDAAFVDAAVRATRRRNRLSAISFPAGCSRRGTQDDTLRDLAGCSPLPQCNQPLARQRDNHGLAGGAAGIGCARPIPPAAAGADYWARALSFWNIKKRQANSSRPLCRGNSPEAYSLPLRDDLIRLKAVCCGSVSRPTAPVEPFVRVLVSAWQAATSDAPGVAASARRNRTGESGCRAGARGYPPKRRGRRWANRAAREVGAAGNPGRRPALDRRGSDFVVAEPAE